jgi:Tol biopolymer transport system component
VDFLVMELVEGASLADQIAARPVAEKDVVALGIQIASALEEAHERRIIHRDLKPGNILLTRKGQAKVLDFGLARLLRPEAEAEVTATVSEPHAVAGTLPYMAPEQFRAQPADSRTDIWALGVVLYEMASGTRPFRGQSGFEISAAVLHTAPPPLSSSVAKPLRAIIDRCLEKEPDRRFQRAGEVRASLETIPTGAGSSQVAVRRRIAPPRWAWAALLAIALAAAGYAGWRTLRSAEPTDPIRANALTTFPGQELYPSISPDGNYVAFTWTGPKQDNTDVYVQQIGAGAPLRLTSDRGNDYNPVWSPDGRWIAFLRGEPATLLGRSSRELRLIAPLGGPERTLGEVSVQEMTDNPVYLTWCADSRCLIVTDMTGNGAPDALFVVSIETGDKRRLTDPQPPVIADTNPSLSPDGESLLFLRRTAFARGELHVLPVRPDITAAGEARHIAVSGLLPDTATWMPEGDEILVATNPLNVGGAALWRVSASDGRSTRVPFVGEDGVMPAVSRPRQGDAARLVYVRSFTDDNIWRIDIADPGIAASAPPAVAIASTKADIHPQLSPDGRRVAFTSTRSGAWEIWLSDPDGSNPVQVTSLRAPTGTGAPRWSPDGRAIVFASDAEDQYDIFIVPSTGGKPRNITSHPALDHVPVFSYDGQWIYFSSARSGQFQVWKVPTSGGEAVQVTKDGGWISQESVDGLYLYFVPTAAIGARTELWRMPTSGGPAVKVVDGVMNAPFAVLQRGIYYVNQISGETQFQFFDFASLKSVTVARSLGIYADGFAASPDGRALLYARRDSTVDDLMLVENFR